MKCLLTTTLNIHDSRRSSHRGKCSVVQPLIDLTALLWFTNHCMHLPSSNYLHRFMQVFLLCYHVLVCIQLIQWINHSINQSINQPIANIFQGHKWRYIFKLVCMESGINMYYLLPISTMQWLLLISIIGIGGISNWITDIKNAIADISNALLIPVMLYCCNWISDINNCIVMSAFRIVDINITHKRGSAAVVRNSCCSYGKGHILHLSRAETTEPINTKFWTIDYRVKIKRITKFGYDRFEGSVSPSGLTIHYKWWVVYYFLLVSLNRLQTTICNGFWWIQRFDLAQGCAF